MGTLHPFECSNLNSSENTKNFLDAGETLPFEEIFSPLILDARDALRREVGATLYGLLTPQAHAGWERYLLVRLTRAGAKAAHSQFQIFKTVRQAFPRNWSATEQGANPCYREFVGEQSAHTLQKLFAEFPALSELCRKMVENWLATVIEFLRRLDADRNNLKARFEGGYYMLPVAAVEAGLSDPHRGGRCVARISFSDGARLIYKPRSLAPEAHFFELLEEVNRMCIPHRLQTVRTWNRGEYGWMENVEESQCRTAADIHDFYWQTGVLLGAVHLARGVDIHHENLIAAGECPVLIDLEALWHTQRVDEADPTAVVSVLRTGFLPQGSLHLERIYDWGALSKQVTFDRTVTTWVRINEDRMALEVGRRVFSNRGHLPVLAGVAYPASGYVPEIQAGFKWLGETILDNEAHRNWFEQWLRKLVQCPRRLIIHPTSYYQGMIEHITQPQSLREETTVANLATIPMGEQPLKLGEVVQALKQFDVPYFEQDRYMGSPPSDPLLHGSSKANYLAQNLVIANSLEGAAHA